MNVGFRKSLMKISSNFPNRNKDDND